MNVTGNTYVTGNFQVNGRINLGDAATDLLTVTGRASIGTNLTVAGNTTISGVLTVAGNTTISGIVNDSKGDVRSAPQNSKSSAYVLVVGDAGKHISITTGGVTINASIFSAGDMVSIYNNSASSQNITQGTSVTLRLAGSASTGTRALAQYGVATLLCVTGGATPVFACSGAGLT